MRARRAGLVLFTMFAFVGVAVPPEAQASTPLCDDYYCQDVWVTAYGQGNQEHTPCWCVDSSAQVWLKFIPGSDTKTQHQIDDWMKQSGHNYYNWLTASFSHECTADDGYQPPDGVPNTFANDSRGFAWAMWQYTPSGYAFRDYRGLTKSDTNWAIVLNIRFTGDPVGVTIKGGAHEILAVGYQTDVDPRDAAYSGSGNTLYGFDIFDPWFNADYYDFWGPGGAGFQNDTFLPIDSWNNKFTADQASNEGSHYDGKWVTVFRATDLSSNPTNNTSPDIGTSQYASIHPSGTAAAGTDSQIGETTGTSIVAPSILGTLQAALPQYALIGNAKFGNIPANIEIGRTLHVDSFDPTQPSYELVEIQAAGVTVAIATVDEVNGGYELGSLTAVKSGTRLPTQPSLDATAATAGMVGHARLEYGPTGQGSPEVLPFIVANDSTGHAQFARGPGSTPKFAAH